MEPLKPAETDIPDVTDPTKGAKTLAAGATSRAAEEAPPDIIVDNLNTPEKSGDTL